MFNKIWTALSGKENTARFATADEIAAVKETEVSGQLWGLCDPRDMDGKSLGLCPMIDAARLVIEDIVKRFPAPPGGDVNALADAERAQAEAARLAATKQVGLFAAENAIGLNLWADAKDRGANGGRSATM